jgi:hypothetical protein
VPEMGEGGGVEGGVVGAIPVFTDHVD